MPGKEVSITKVEPKNVRRDVRINHGHHGHRYQKPHALKYLLRNRVDTGDKITYFGDTVCSWLIISRGTALISLMYSVRRTSTDTSIQSTDWHWKSHVTTSNTEYTSNSSYKVDSTCQRTPLFTRMFDRAHLSGIPRNHGWSETS